MEDEGYLLGVLCYIHNNPVKAALTDNIINYQWSSAKDYFNKNTDLIDENFMNEILGRFKNKDEFDIEKELEAKFDELFGKIDEEEKQLKEG